MYGQGTGPVLLRNVACDGAETNLLECQKSYFVASYCTHERDVGLKCEGKNNRVRALFDIHLSEFLNCICMS